MLLTLDLAYAIQSDARQFRFASLFIISFRVSISLLRSAKLKLFVVSELFPNVHKSFEYSVSSANDRSYMKALIAFTT